MLPVKTEGNFVVLDGEARRAAFAMESDVRLFQGCEKLLSAAKEVIGNWERGDLAAAVRRLGASIKQVEGDMTEKGREVFVLSIEHRNGRNILVCETEARAYDELYDFVKEYWSEMPEAIGQIPEDRDLAIQIYFEEKDGEETFGVEKCEVLRQETHL